MIHVVLLQVNYFIYNSLHHFSITFRPFAYDKMWLSHLCPLDIRSGSKNIIRTIIKVKATFSLLSPLAIKVPIIVIRSTISLLENPASLSGPPTSPCFGSVILDSVEILKNIFFYHEKCKKAAKIINVKSPYLFSIISPNRNRVAGGMLFYHFFVSSWSFSVSCLIIIFIFNYLYNNVRSILSGLIQMSIIHITFAVIISWTIDVLASA